MKHLIKTTLVITAIIFSATILLSTKITAKKLQHVVAFNYKPEITAEQKQKIRDAFYALQKDIPEIKAFEGGDDIKPNGKKFTQCFVVTVKNEHDLNVYGSHPKHKAFSAMVDPMLAEVMVVDYWAE
ncbi:MAG: Dabb family protein [Sphingobacteriales bacterium]|nr:MAG: Dabb family protein [Sphingobacteriales bacterium]